MLEIKQTLHTASMPQKNKPKATVTEGSVSLQVGNHVETKSFESISASDLSCVALEHH